MRAKEIFRRIALPCLVSAVLVLPAAAQQQEQRQQEQQTPQAADRQLNDREKEFLNDAAMSSMTEIRLGKMAQEKSRNNQIQRYGQDVVNDHTNAQEKVKQLGQKYNVTIPNQLDQEHQGDVDRLSKLSANEFDPEFITTMMNNHEEGVQMFRDMAQTAQAQDIRQFASETVPVLQRHLDRARELQNTMTQQLTEDRTRQEMPAERETRQRAPAATDREMADEDLPGTAGYQPLLALLGLGSIGAAAGFRFIRRGH